MSNFDVSYCTNEDLKLILPTIADYDGKRLLTGWSLESGSIYQLGSVGAMDMLYRDGLELGTAQVSKAACTTDGKWFYDSTIDTVYVFATTTVSANSMEGGYDWTAMVVASISKASEITRTIVGKPIIKHRYGTRDYDEVIVSGAAAIAVGRLVRPYDRELADSLEFVYNYDGDEFQKGMLQRVRDSQISLSNEITPALINGIPVEDSVDDATTGDIRDIKGRATQNDTLIVDIVAGGNLAKGTASVVSYRVKGKDSTGQGMSTLVDTTIITGEYQSLGQGMSIMFEVGTSATPLVYTTSDSWLIRVSCEEVETHQGVHANIATTTW